MQSFNQYIKSALAEIYSDGEIHTLSNLILEKITGFSRIRLLVSSTLVLSENQQEQARAIIERLKRHEPVQYILGETEFYGLTFKVSPAVLIPRPETEELVEWIITSSPLRCGELLDIGTGSGCIAVSLKKNLPTARVSAIDISAEALSIARENAALNGADIDFLQADILKTSRLKKKYDVIVSNPPYVPDSDKQEMQPAVLNYEPHSALFVTDADPLIFYRKIALLAKNHLMENGKLYCEIHRGEGKNCRELLHSLGFRHVALRQDIAGNDRMVCAKV